MASAEALVPSATLGELMTGACRVKDPAREFVRLRKALAPATPVFSTKQTTFRYGWVTAHLQRIGLSIPTNDAWNAALALEHDVPLLSDDAHFHRVPGLRFVPVR